MQMGTARKASHRLPSQKEKNFIQETSVSDQGDATDVAASQDQNMIDASKDHDQEISQVVFPLTDECKHYTHVSQVVWDIQKLAEYPLCHKQANPVSGIGINARASSLSMMLAFA